MAEAHEIRMAASLTLPLDAVTQTFGILAKRRAGKSYTARRLVEQLHHAGQQVVIVDPKGDWWGIRSSADGKSPGLPIVILGGEHGDVRLEANAGEVVAKLAVEERVSLALDLSEFRKHEVATFMTGFLENLYRLKAREASRTPMMLMIDEADAIAPQRPQKGEERMLGAAEDIVRRGGQRGIGCTMVTQRAAVLNKNVLTQIQMLICLRTIAPQDLDACSAWIDVHGTREQRATLMESLPSLPVGDAWFWSPGWPTEAGIFERAHVLPIETFDSGATPKPGEKRIEPKNLADVDLEALKRQMAATLERAKADNPKALRAEIGRLKKELGAIQSGEVIASDVARMVAAAVARERGRMKAFVGWANDVTRRVHNLLAVVEHDHFGPFWDEIARLNNDWESGRADEATGLDSRYARKPTHHAREMRPDIAGSNPAFPDAGVAQSGKSTANPGPSPAKAQGLGSAEVARSNRAAGTPNLGKGERIVLTAIAQYPDGVSRETLTVLTGYKHSSRNTYIQRLTANGYVYPRPGGEIATTESGIEVLGPDFESLPTGAALREYWLNRLSGGEREILAELIKAYPEHRSRNELSMATEYKRSSRDAYLQRLVARRLIETNREGVRASAELF